MEVVVMLVFMCSVYTEECTIDRHEAPSWDECVMVKDVLAAELRAKAEAGQWGIVACKKVPEAPA